MIELKNIYKIYKNKKGVETRALDGVNLTLPDSGMVFVTGKSGCGKSTLLNICGGLDSTDSGEFIFNGVSMQDFKSSDYSYYRNTYVGFIFQEYNLLENFTVRDNVKIALELQNQKTNEEQINDILRQVEMLDLADKKANCLSGGQKQRVAIARALVKNPEFILADEPTGALDYESGEQVMSILKALSKEKLVVVVSHDKEQANKYADRIIEMRDGKVIFDSCNQVSAEQKQTHNKFEKQKYHLPARYTTKMGAASLKTKPVRLIFTIFLTLIAFLCFGIFTITIFYNEKNSAISTLNASEDFEYLSFSKAYQQEQKLYVDGKETYSEVKRIKTGFTEQELQTLAQKYPNCVATVDITEGVNVQGIDTVGDYFYKTNLDKFALVNDSMVWLAGKAPANSDEIAITDFMFETFQVLKLKYIDSDKELKLSSYKDILGKKIALGYKNFTFTVSGVFRGEQVPKSFDKLHEASKKHQFNARDYDSWLWRDIRDDGLYCVAALTKEGVARCGEEMVLGQNERLFVDDYFLLDSGITTVNIVIDGREEEVLNNQFTNISPYADCTGNGMLKLYDMNGNIISSLPSESIGVPTRFFIDLVFPLFEDYFDKTANPAIDKSDFNKLYADMVTFKKSEQDMLADFAELRRLMDVCSIDNPWLIVTDKSYNKYSVKVGGVYLGETWRMGGIYMTDKMFDQIYTGAVNKSTRYLTKTKYKAINNTIFTSVFVNYSKDNVNEVVSNYYKIAEDDSTITVDNMLFESVLEFTKFIQIFAKVLITCGTIFCVFASLLMFNFISASISAQKREIGVLRALGATPTDLFRIFLVEALIIALSCAILCCIGTAVLCTVFNNLFIRDLNITRVKMFVFNPVCALLIFVVALLTAVIATWLPVWIYSRKTPADGIRNL